MVTVILCIWSQVIEIRHALSIQDIKSPKVSIGQRWIWKTVCLEESQTQAFEIRERSRFDLKTLRPHTFENYPHLERKTKCIRTWLEPARLGIYGVYISIVTFIFSCNLYTYIYILIRAFPSRIAFQAEFTGGFGTFPNLQAWKGIRLRAVSVGLPNPHGHSLGSWGVGARLQLHCWHESLGPDGF